MLKRLSLGQTLVLSAGVLLLITFILTNALTLRRTYKYSHDQAKTIAFLNSKYNSEKVDRNFEKIATIGKGMAIQMETMVQNGTPSRELIISTMKNTLNSHNDIFGVAITYEPNALDGKDANYIGKEGNDSKGQFMPYVTRKTGNTFATELCFYNYYTQQQTKWYNIPKSTNKTYLTEPTTYLVQGNNITMASVVVPILRDGKFVGVVSIDTSLDYLQTEIQKVKPMGGFAEIISSEGIYVANGADSKKVLKDVSKEKEWDSLLKRTSRGEEFTEFGISSTTGEEVLRVFSTISIQGTDQYWTYVSVIPVSNVFAEYIFSFKLILTVGLILFAFTIYINYSFISKDL